MTKLHKLWRGEYSLSDTFWTGAVAIGLAVNVLTSLGFLTLITLDQPLLAVAVGYGLSLPYNLAAVVGVWRAAARHDGLPVHADVARGATLVLMLVLSLT